MAMYLTEKEIKKLMESSVKTFVRESIEHEKISEDLMELLKHNFYAKYAIYDREKRQIEIGVNETKRNSMTYPNIRLYSYPVDKASEWITKSLHWQRHDLEFYAKILSRKNDMLGEEIVVL